MIIWLVGLLKIKTYRPFPAQEVLKLIKPNTHVAVLEKAISLGQAGPLYNDIVETLSKQKNRNALIKNYIVGLGGRDVSEVIIKKIIIDSPKKNDSLKFYG